MVAGGGRVPLQRSVCFCRVHRVEQAENESFTIAFYSDIETGAPVVSFGNSLILRSSERTSFSNDSSFCASVGDLSYVEFGYLQVENVQKHSGLTPRTRSPSTSKTEKPRVSTRVRSLPVCPSRTTVEGSSTLGSGVRKEVGSASRSSLKMR